MCYKKLFAIFLSLILLAAISPIVVLAGDGLPGSPHFGFGAHLDLQGHQIDAALNAAEESQLDWIAISWDWGSYWPEANSDPNWDALDQVIYQVEGTQINVMISITNAPIWALGNTGPEQQPVSDLIMRLLQRYPDNFMALELFPAANTTEGWGAKPNAQNYANLLKTVNETIRAYNADITLIAAGLTQAKTRSDQDALTFLQALYDANAASDMLVVSLHLPEIAYHPTTSVNDADTDPLRSYETLREVMLQNDHQSGLIWITNFTWHADLALEPNNQAYWLDEAYRRMRSQLYIGAAFFDGLNTSSATTLIQQDASINPAFDSLVQLIAAESSEHTIKFSLPLRKSNPGKTLHK